MPSRPKSSNLAILVAVLMACALPRELRAADGDLDPAFGVGGKVVTSFDVPASAASAVALQPDGKIVAAGWLFDKTANVDFALARYRPDGSLDPSFGSAGRVRTDFFGGFDVAYALAIQPDGKIVAGGVATIGLDSLFALVRYNADGSLDSTFDSDGKVTGGFFGLVSDVVLQPDGKIVAAGGGYPAGATSGDVTLARYLPNGNLDASFGVGGVAHMDFSGETDGASAVLLLPEGKLLAVGTADTNVTSSDIALARFNSDGTPDATFGSGGKKTTDFFGRGDSAQAAALQTDGKFVVAAGIFNPNDPAARLSVLRYLPSGDLDISFGDGGRASVTFQGFDAAAYAVAIQTNGQIIAAGLAFGPNQYDFALARFNPDGSADTSFGPGGAGVVTDFFGLGDGIYALVVQPDGRIVAAGSAIDSTRGYLALARYLGTPPAPACAHSAGFWKSHRSQWPVASLTLGSQPYSRAQIAALLEKPVRGDASLLLARELIAAKFNIAAGAGSVDLAALVSSADSILSGFAGELPYTVPPGSSLGRSMVTLSGHLASWNHRRSGPQCGDSTAQYP